ncbi:MAG: nucleotidyltransferase domain-containing protein [Sulfolobaceae archaeon]
MARNYVLDRDILIDVNNNIYVALTNYNPYGYYFAYLKYTYTGSGIWKGYERVYRYYGVHNLIKLNQEFMFEPCYDVSFPILRWSKIRYHLKPEEFVEKFLKKSQNNLQEEILIEVLEKIGTKGVGVTGSLLAGISHKLSDVDIIIYGCKRSMEFIESFQGFQNDNEWIVETAENYKIDISLAKLLYDNRRRGIYKGVKISILFNSGETEKYCKKICRKLGKVKFLGNIEGDCKALFYPAEALVNESNDVKVDKIISYEGIFSSALFGNKRVYVEGMLMDCEDEKIVIVGDREIRGLIRPL